MAVGTAVCAVLMLAVFALLGVTGLYPFRPSIVFGAVGGSVVAILNFTLMCLTVQSVTGITDPKQLHARVQASYNGRLMLQALWGVAALVAPFLQPVAALLPLLFPRVVIFYLQATGQYKPEPKSADAETTDGQAPAQTTETEPPADPETTQER